MERSYLTFTKERNLYTLCRDLIEVHIRLIMRTPFIYLLFSFLSIASTHAQGMKKMAQKTEFESRLAKEAQTVESIESDFTQVKYLDVFDEKVTSKWKFYYQ